MGNSCCNPSSADANNNTDTQERVKGRIQATEGWEQEAAFLGKYDKIAKALGHINGKRQSWCDANRTKLKTFPQGLYQGAIDSGSRNEYGVMLYNEGFYYQGGWKSDLRWGAGVLINSEGDYYSGSFIQNNPNGEGTYQKYKSPRKYVGNWKCGVQNGKGVQYFEDGSVYQGYFVNGLKQGQGKLTFSDQTYFEGHFSNDAINGEGKQISKTYFYTGEWRNNQMHGTGRCQFFDDENTVIESYVGEYANGLKHGFGEYRWADGGVYKGNWSRGQVQSNGVFISSR